MSKFSSSSLFILLTIGSLIRLILFSKNSLRQWLQNRVEISTPLTSWTRVLEGLYLKNTIGLSTSYEGDLVHEIPLMLRFYELLIKAFGLSNIGYVFIAIDGLNAILLYSISHKIISYINLVESFNIKAGKYQRFFESIKLNKQLEKYLQTSENFSSKFWSLFVVSIYLFNPLNCASCISLSTVLVHNLILLLWLNFLLNGQILVSLLFLSIHANIQVYSFMLITASVSFIIQKFNYLNQTKSNWIQIAVKHTVLFIFLTLAIFGVNLYLENFNTRFIQCTYMFIFKVPDLVPNMGLFWYFFTEMFDHFATFFTVVFQFNAFLYAVPLTLRLKDDPIVNILIQIGFLFIFKSYPSVGETGFYISLLPCLAYLFPLMRNFLVYSCMLLVSTVLAPIMFYLWLGSGGGNANFYFAITLVYSVGQIFMLVDVLYASLKSEYIKLNGCENPKNKDGTLARFSLE